VKRTPATVGPPSCWGRFRGDAACRDCPAAKSCTRVTDEHAERRTVAESVAALAAESEASAEATVRPEELAFYAADLYEKAGGNPFVAKSWLTNRRFMEAMAACIDACTKAGWPPKRYVQSQVEALTPNIKLGWPLHPGSFFGEKADARFSRWWVRSMRKYGDVRRDRKAEYQRDAHAAASNAYAVIRLSADDAHADAVAAALDLCPEWHRSAMSPLERLSALQYALTARDPLLPHQLLLPTTWTWSQARAAVAAVFDYRRSSEEQ
jgi:hypothetical protein